MKATYKVLSIRLAALSVLTLAGVAINASSAEAWGAWGNWAPRDTWATCPSSDLYNFSGASIASTRLLRADTGSDFCGLEVQARAWPKKANGTYLTVTAQSTHSQGSRSATVESTFDLTHSQCRSTSTIC